MAATAIDPQPHASLHYKAGQFSSPRLLMWPRNFRLDPQQLARVPKLTEYYAANRISVPRGVVDHGHAALQRILDI